MSKNVGIVPPPPGVTPDFDSTPWLLNANRIAVGVGVALCTLSLIMRLYTKACVSRTFWWDDVVIIVAWTFVIGAQAVILYGYANSGFAIHIWNMTTSLLGVYRKTLLAFAVLYTVALALAKLAIIMLYYRLLQTVRTWKYVLWILAGCICISSAALVLAVIFACHPIQEGWNDDLSKTNACDRRPGIQLGTTIANVVSDVMLILVATVSLWRLQIPLLQKIGIICLCGIGCFTVIISIARLVNLIPFLESSDQPHQLGLACLLIVIELNLVILCGSLSYIRQFLRHHAPCLMNRDERLGHHIILSTHSLPARTPKSQHVTLEAVHDDVEPARNGSCDTQHSESAEVHAEWIREF